MRRILFTAYFLISLSAFAQNIYREEYQHQLPYSARIYDSVMASRIPVLDLPGDYLLKALPASVDNSKNNFFRGIVDQSGYFSCQQQSAVNYTFGYEMNRLRNRNGSLSGNRYPPHYTWNFMNDGDKMTGVSFFYSWDVMKQQGHPSFDDFGPDTSSSVLWMNGYDKYYAAMKNRLKAVYSIPVNTAGGVLTLKHYLNDHLDGSPTGGIVCFGASSNFVDNNFRKLPDGTPEAGKDVITGFYPLATHGMTIVGYNDSIRYDLNGDGKYTNNIDITGDGVVDVRDWETGAYRLANSYGKWWSDEGFCYVLYRAMALYYGNNPDFWDPVHGAWNHCVYVLVPDPDYQPRLTLKASLTYNSRNKIRIKAGVSADISRQFPEHLMTFPVFSFQGGNFAMLGADSIPANRNIELGLDVTPLLSFVEPEHAAKFFLIVEEQDTSHIGEGVVDHCSFIDYTNGTHEMISSQTEVPIGDNDITFLTVTGTIGFDKITISTDHLPPYSTSPAYSFQLQAGGGTQPYSWSLTQSYEKRKISSPFPVVDQQPLYYEADGIPYKRVKLPFRFPFYGKEYDTVYVNAYGFISFESTHLPYMYLKDEEGMLRRSKVISPAFSEKNLLEYGAKGMWMESSANESTFRWKLRVTGYDTSQYLNFSLRLHSNGEFEFFYGEMPAISHALITYSGFSKGDELNYNLWTNWSSITLSAQAFLFHPNPVPSGISVTNNGLISVVEADTGFMYDISVKVQDRNKISDEKTFILSTGLEVSVEIVSGNDTLFTFGEPAHFKLTLINRSNEPYQNLSVKLATSDSAIIINDSLSSISQLSPGSSITIPQAFTFRLTHPLPDQCPVDFTINASTSRHLWKREFSLLVSAPELKTEKPEIFDGVNGLLDPGEVADLVIPVSNIGSLGTDSMECTLTCGDTLVTIISPQVQDIGKIGSRSSLDISYSLKASRFAPDAHLTEMILTINDHRTVNMTFPITLVLGKLPVAIIDLATGSLSPAAMMSALDSLNVNYRYMKYIPPQPEIYGSVFLVAGTTGCHLLSQEEGSLLADFLTHGGNLYLESYFMWFNTTKTEVNPYFKYLSYRVPIYEFPEINGISETFSELMHFSYNSIADYAIFSLNPVAPAYSTFTNSDSIPAGLQVVYDGNDYKTIGSMLEFGALTDGSAPSDKRTLMRRYLDFFNINLSGPKIFFHTDRHFICRWGTVYFFDDSYNDIISRQWEFPGGNPSLSTEANPVVQYIDNGSYDVKLTVSDGINTRTITKKKYITVNVCSEVNEKADNNLFRIYPNPADDKLKIEFFTPLKSGTKLILNDLMGKTVITQVCNPGDPFLSSIIDVSHIPAGIYFLRVINSEWNKSVKVLIR